MGSPAAKGCKLPGAKFDPIVICSRSSAGAHDDASSLDRGSALGTRKTGRAIRTALVAARRREPARWWRELIRITRTLRRTRGACRPIEPAAAIAWCRRPRVVDTDSNGFGLPYRTLVERITASRCSVQISQEGRRQSHGGTVSSQQKHSARTVLLLVVANKCDRDWVDVVSIGVTRLRDSVGCSLRKLLLITGTVRCRAIGRDKQQQFALCAGIYSALTSALSASAASDAEELPNDCLNTSALRQRGGRDRRDAGWRD